MITGGFANERLLSRPAGTLSSILNGGEGWGEEVLATIPPNVIRKWYDTDDTIRPGPVIAPGKFAAKEKAKIGVAIRNRRKACAGQWSDHSVV